jgi:hypothetical protein
VAEPLLQSELAHPGFPHPGSVRMAQCVWGHPRRPQAGALACAREQANQAA